LEELPDALMSKALMLSLSSETTIRQARDILRNMQLSPNDENLACKRESAIAVMEKGEIAGVLEVGSLLDFEG
jgi:hypothetical protein